MNGKQILLAVAVLLGLTTVLFADQEKEPTSKTAPKKVDQVALEKAFAKKMSGSVLVGNFTVDGKKNDKPPRAERYELTSVTKVNKGVWMFVTRIKYGQNDVTVPLALPVIWAGDTPMVSLTNFAIPGMGTFSARVIFHGDRYVGIWQHGKVGGHMFGKIERLEKKDDDGKDKKK